MLPCLLNFIQHKLTFIPLEPHTSFFETAQNRIEISEMLLLCSSRHQDVIQIHASVWNTLEQSLWKVEGAVETPNGNQL